MIDCINHIGINVKDMQTSIRFYQEVLGLERVGEIIDQKDAGCRAQYMKAPGGVMVEFLEYYPEVKPGGYDVMETGVYRHIAFGVAAQEDLQKYLEKLRKAKESAFPTIEVPQSPEYLPYLKLDILLFKDPNGIEVELCVKRAENA